MSVETTAVRVELVDGVARPTLLHGGTYLRPRLLGTAGAHARVALVGSYAALLAGDEVSLDVEAGPGVHLELVEPTGMVAYDADDVAASWVASLRVASSALLTWRAASFVVSAGANVTRRTEIGLADGGVALLGETLVLGRAREGAGRLYNTQRATLGGRDLLVEDLDLRESPQRSTPGILGTSRVVATTTLLGSSGPDRLEEHETRLAGPGALARASTHEAHEATAALSDTWQRWYAHVTTTHPARGGTVDCAHVTETVTQRVS